MEGSFLNNGPENTNPPIPENNSENQQEKFEKLTELLMEAPAVETEEMIVLRDNPRAWEEMADEVIEKKAGKDAEYRKELHLGVLIEVAVLYYKQGNTEGYVESLKVAIEVAYQGNFNEVRYRLEEILK